MAKKEKKNNTMARGFRADSGYTMHIRTNHQGTLNKFDPRVNKIVTFKQIKNK